MPDIIATIDQLIEEALEIQGFLEISQSEQLEEALQRGNDLSVYIARTGKMKADAKYRLNEAMQSDLIQQLTRLSNTIPGMSAKAVNAIVDSACKREQYVFDMVERLNRTATHQLEWCRSVLATAREDRRAQIPLKQG